MNHSNDATETSTYPQDPRPQGYEPLFSWISQQCAIRKHRNRIVMFSAIIALLVIGFISWLVYGNMMDSAMAERIKLAPVSELSAIVNQHDSLPGKSLESLDGRIQSEVDRMAGELQGASSSEDLSRISNLLRTLLDVRHASRRREISGLLTQVETRQEDALIAAIGAARRSNDTKRAQELIADYRSRFANGPRKAEVDAIEGEVTDRRRQELRSAVRGIRIGNRDSLTRKAAEIRRYLDEFSDDPDAQRMNTAVRLCEQLAASDAVRLRFRSCGFADSKGKRYHQVRWLIDGSVLSSPAFQSDSERTSSTFDETLDLSYQKWNSLKIELWDLNWGDEKIAEELFSVLRDLAQWTGSRRISVSQETSDWRGSAAWVTIGIQLRSSEGGGWSAAEESALQAYGDFIAPGSRW